MNKLTFKWMATTFSAVLLLAWPTASQADIPRLFRDDALVEKVDRNFANVEARLKSLEAMTLQMDRVIKQGLKNQESLTDLTAAQRDQLEKESNQLNGRSDQLQTTLQDIQTKLEEFKTETNAAIGDMRESLTHTQTNRSPSDQDECSGAPVDVSLNDQEPFQACTAEQELFDAAKDAWQAKQWQEAITLLSELRLTYPNTGYLVAALFYQASAHIELGQTHAGRLFMRRLKAEFPDQREELQSLEGQLSSKNKKKVGKT